VVLSIAFGIHYYVWLRLVADPMWGAPWGSIATWALVALGLSIPTAFVAGRRVPRALALPLSVLAFGWMGLIFLVVMLLLPAELVRAGVALARASEQVQASGPSFDRVIAAVVCLLGVGAGAVAVSQALRPPRVRTLTVRLEGLPEALRGFTIVQLTDIHAGSTIGRAFLEDVVRRTNDLDPDVVAITGDLADGPVSSLRGEVEPLRGLRARHGVFFVTGNHEYYSGVVPWLAFLTRLGIRVLRNERVSVEHLGAKLDIAGVDDWMATGMSPGHGPDLRRALAGRDVHRTLVLLAHEPKQIFEAAELGVSLQLSGHTHGGQIFPFNYFVRLQQPYIRGLHEHGGTQLYVSPGTGYWGPPMRLGVPGEITRIVLEVAATPAA